MKITCINCPIGCLLNVEHNAGVFQIDGYQCKRGIAYAKSEFLCPQRSLTSLVKTKSGGVVSIKTSKSVEKVRILDIASYLKNCIVPDNVQINYVVERNVLGLGVDIIVTGNPNLDVSNQV